MFYMAATARISDVKRMFGSYTPAVIQHQTGVIVVNWGNREWSITSDEIKSKDVCMTYKWTGRQFEFELEDYRPRSMRLIATIVNNTSGILKMLPKAWRTTKVAIIYLIFQSKEHACNIVRGTVDQQYVEVQWHNYVWRVTLDLVFRPLLKDPFRINGSISLKDRDDAVVIHFDFMKLRLSFNLHYYYKKQERTTNDPVLEVLDDLFGGREVTVHDIAVRKGNQMPLSLMTVLQGKGRFYYFAPISHKIKLIMQLLQQTGLLANRKSNVYRSRNAILEH